MQRAFSFASLAKPLPLSSRRNSQWKLAIACYARTPMREELLRDGESSLLEESMYVALAPEVAKLLSQM